jgi:hypothetical protein
VKVPSSKERDDWWRVFYQGPAFSTLARFLLLGSNVFSIYTNFNLFSKNNIAFCFAFFLTWNATLLQMLHPIGWLVSPFQHRNMFMTFSLFTD